MKKKKKQPKNKNEKTKTHHPSMNRICKPLPRWTHWQVSQASQSMILCMCIQLLGCVWLFATHGLQPTGLLCPWNFPGKDTGVVCHFLLQRIFPTHGLNLGLLNCRQIFYWLSYQGSCSICRELSQARLRDFTFTLHFPALETEMATHYSVLAWRIPGMGEPGGLPSPRSHRVRHNWSDLAA